MEGMHDLLLMEYGLSLAVSEAQVLCGGIITSLELTADVGS